MVRPLLLFVVVCSSLPIALAQDNGAPLPKPAPPLAPIARPDDSVITKKVSGSINAIVVEARRATAEGRYADSEAMMLKVTHDNPTLILPWVELGAAQLGLKKFDDAKTSYMTALGIDPATIQKARSDNFYVQPDAPGVVAASATRASRNTAGDDVVVTTDSRTPEVVGVSWAGLGEIYAHEKKTAEAQAAFDKAVKTLPARAPQFRHNETVVFFLAGNSDAQLEAANQAIALDPTRPANYYFKGQALVAKATMDSSGKMILPPGCADAYQKYLQLDPKGPYSSDAKAILAGAGITK
ncbi:tetratricopeptide repeat protein [Occallatibacter riparius]|uniref:Tetratricopeptide repeat protein n=1 Tax=Occallatibacter riparius TaxID=1002689 RepID=A0A9J7BIZ5_9BACT|nr:tetratricopeptide repeat protein [Occallatibacter riparius]UWZ82655.1 tetratricopeptide repeat protein [Occallatibacter riparius]